MAAVPDEFRLWLLGQVDSLVNHPIVDVPEGVQFTADQFLPLVDLVVAMTAERWDGIVARFPDSDRDWYEQHEHIQEGGWLFENLVCDTMLARIDSSGERQLSEGQWSEEFEITVRSYTDETPNIIDLIVVDYLEAQQQEQ